MNKDVEALAEGERRQLADWWLFINDGTLGSFRRSLVPMVERIVAAHVQAARADELEQAAGALRPMPRDWDETPGVDRARMQLRARAAALRTPDATPEEER